ncbi:WS/DGAT domain-containing protein [Mycobacterium kansasii]|uniref:WS/DGAT domain-containing protein n=1 Tax=Mycobacterium kansasii TaxID=1768 RepID=UPI0015E25688|nr:WS/DGAT domain-containing protein [Mycobacterium kansasii]
MADRRRLGIQDALWLEMDRPNNLMVVDTVVWTADPLDWGRVREVLEERLINRYPVFRSLAVKDRDGSWWWELADDFDFGKHVTVVDLKDPADRRELQALVASHRTEMLDRTRPLWQGIWVDRYRGGSAMIVRTHHAVADGMRMVELSMSLFDASPAGGPIRGPGIVQHAARPHPPGQPMRQRLRTAAGRATATAQRARSLLEETVSDPGGRATDIAAGMIGVAAAVPRILSRANDFGRLALQNPVGAGHTITSSARATASGVAESVGATMRAALPGSGTLIDVFSAAPGDVDTLRKLLLGTRNDSTIWTGTAGQDKAVAWSEPIPLAKVKAVARANNCTVNDVLVASAAGALHDYLQAHHARCSAVTFMIPVNLKPVDVTLPDNLGNEFALVQLELPTDEADPLRVLAVAKKRMNRIKHGHEAAVAFRLQETIAGFNRQLYEASVDLFTNRTIGTLTNVPGPPMPVYLAGSKVAGIVGWAPVSGNQPMSFTISTYNGNVVVGIACDKTLVPDHETIVDGFAGAFERLLAATSAVSS